MVYEASITPPQTCPTCGKAMQTNPEARQEVTVDATALDSASKGDAAAAAEGLREAVELLREWLEAADETLDTTDDVRAMLRYGNAVDKVRVFLAKKPEG
jgi:hypothetical protein